MDCQDLEIEGVRLIVPDRHGDERGFFSEVYNRKRFAEWGIDDVFVQDNHSLSVTPGTVRGLHFQVDPHPIAKLVRVIRGRIWDVVVDLRHGSPTFGRHVALELSADNWRQIYVPEGCAHGFSTLEPDTEVAYKVTDHWSAAVDKGVLWNDPDLGIDWKLGSAEPVLSDRDRSLPSFSDLPPYFQWVGS